MPRRVFKSPTADKPFVCGFTSPWDSPQTVDLLSYTDFTALSTFFLSHHLDHVRIIGGTASRFFLYNDMQVNGVWLSDDANALLNAYYTTRDYSPIINRCASNPWNLYLKLCAGAAIQPIIPLNTIFYVYANALYPVEELNQGSYLSHGIDGMALDPTRWTNKLKI